MKIEKLILEDDEEKEIEKECLADNEKELKLNWTELNWTEHAYLKIEIHTKYKLTVFKNKRQIR